MSQTTFSLMSNPDLLLTIESYHFMQEKIKIRLDELSFIDETGERFALNVKRNRIKELLEALESEYSKR